MSAASFDRLDPAAGGRRLAGSLVSPGRFPGAAGKACAKLGYQSDTACMGNDGASKFGFEAKRKMAEDGAVIPGRDREKAVVINNSGYCVSAEFCKLD